MAKKAPHDFRDLLDESLARHGFGDLSESFAAFIALLDRLKEEESKLPFVTMGGVRYRQECADALILLSTQLQIESAKARAGFGIVKIDMRSSGNAIALAIDGLVKS